MKRIGFMTGGGDCAGINAFLAACIRRGGEGYGLEFVGIRRAFEGACADQIEDFLMPLTAADAVGLEKKPSTILESSRLFPWSEANKTAGLPEKLLANLKKAGIDAVLATGGNDTIKSTNAPGGDGYPGRRRAQEHRQRRLRHRHHARLQDRDRLRRGRRARARWSRPGPTAASQPGGDHGPRGGLAVVGDRYRRRRGRDPDSGETAGSGAGLRAHRRDQPEARLRQYRRGRGHPTPADGSRASGDQRRRTRWSRP